MRQYLSGHIRQKLSSCLLPFCYRNTPIQAHPVRYRLLRFLVFLLRYMLLGLLSLVDRASLNQRAVRFAPYTAHQNNQLLKEGHPTQFLESAGRRYYDVLENVSYLVKNLHERAIRRGHAEPTPCLGVNNCLLFIPRAGAMTSQHAHPGGVPIEAGVNTVLGERQNGFK